ncbi:MAG: hypothetical protein PUJ82_14180 [Spirochaetales bacterium]|nr:hypothetical protein [Spirochaetales bacterium]
MQLVSRLPPLRYRFGLSDPPKAVAPRSVRCLNTKPAPFISNWRTGLTEDLNFTVILQTGTNRDRPCFIYTLPKQKKDLVAILLQGLTNLKK